MAPVDLAALGARLAAHVQVDSGKDPQRLALRRVAYHHVVRRGWRGEEEVGDVHRGGVAGGGQQRPSVLGRPLVQLDPIEPARRRPVQLGQCGGSGAGGEQERGLTTGGLEDVKNAPRALRRCAVSAGCGDVTGPVFQQPPSEHSPARQVIVHAGERGTSAGASSWLSCRWRSVTSGP